MLLVVHPTLDARSTSDLITAAKAKPHALNFASTGTGSITHLAAELFERAAGISMTHVAYKGTGPALADLVGGQVQLMFVPLGSGMPYVRSTRLRALGVASARRSSVAPDIPTISESGVAGFGVGTWYGVLAPAGTPASMITRLNYEIAALMKQPDTVRQLGALGFDASTDTPAEFRTFIASELQKWGTVIAAIGLAIDR